MVSTSGGKIKPIPIDSVSKQMGLVLQVFLYKREARDCGLQPISVTVAPHMTNA